MQLGSEGMKLTLAVAGAASAGTAVNGAALDMAGFDGVLIFGTIATVNAGNYLKAQQDTVVGLGTVADLAGSKIVPGTNGMIAMLDLNRPTKEFVRGVFIRAGANTITGDMYYLQYKSSNPPTVNTVATLVQALALRSPAEGTP